MTKEELENKVGTVLRESFIQYETDKVPDIENSPDSRLTHGNTGFLGNFTFLYVDMRGSSAYTDQHRLKTITKIYKAYHHCMVACVKKFNGKVRSFDGDRVLAVFAGPNKENDAVFCAMKMVACKTQILKPKINTAFLNDSFSLGVGIATGNSMVSKAGAGYDKNTRDLIWIGDPPNLGSKLSDVADDPYSIYICQTTFDKLNDDNKFSTKNLIRTDMWTKALFTFKGKLIPTYKTGFYRPF
ncbi:MAG TPA: adenylate/guanylate cyclase domain-containing protein [Pseudobdellovibrionaceae bacterium]|nr:adenylate/guanylate cyclase domain-containing protein [Pseudobdellovibrionaceae bacterium]